MKAYAGIDREYLALPFVQYENRWLSIAGPQVGVTLYSFTNEYLTRQFELDTLLAVGVSYKRLLRVPFVGRFVTSATVHNFSQTLAVLLENGITTAEALRMTERTIPNRAMQAALEMVPTKPIPPQAP